MLQNGFIKYSNVKELNDFVLIHELTFVIVRLIITNKYLKIVLLQINY